MCVEEAIRYLMRTEISSLAGSWDITEEEVEEIKRTLREGWKTWRGFA